MRNGKKGLLAAMLVGAGLLAVNVSLARAEPITSEAGTISSFTLHSSGGGMGAVIDIDLFGPSATTRRNNLPEPVPIPTTFSQHITLLVTSIMTQGTTTIFGFTQTSGPASKDVFPFAGGTVSFSYMLSGGTSVTQTSHELNLEGLLRLLGNTSVDDYSPFRNDGGEHNLTLTDPNHDLGSIIRFGGDANGSAAFSQSAGMIPEPGSFVLLAVGALPLLGGYVMRRRLKKGA